MKKRIISAGLAAMLAVSAITTSASAAIKADQTVTGSGVAAMPTLKVTMPKNMNFIINPYKLAVNVSGKADATSEQNASIVTSYAFGTDGAWVIQNQSNVRITAKVYGVYKLGNTDEEKFEFTQAATAAAASSGKKKVNLYVSGKVGSDGTPAQITLVSAAPEDWSATTGITTFQHIPALSGDTPGTLNITMTGETKDGTGCDAWTEKDTVTVTYGFKFDFEANEAAPAADPDPDPDP